MDRAVRMAYRTSSLWGSMSIRDRQGRHVVKTKEGGRDVRGLGFDKGAFIIFFDC